MPPYGTVEVGTERDPARIAAFRLPDALLVPGTPLLTFAGDDQTAALSAAELDPDALSIAAGLDQMAKRKFLDFLISFCCPAFRLGRSAAFAQVCAKLALDCGLAAGPARCVAQGYV